MKLYTKILLICSLLFLWSGSASAQNTTLYPGDVNDNGIANHIDLLYIGSAFGEAGNARVTYAYSFEATVSGGTAPYTYLWTSNNSFVSNQLNPTLTFEVEGNYFVCATITDALNETCTVCSTIIIDQNPNFCNYTINAELDPIQNSYQFIVDTVGIQSNVFSWDFGDNNTSNLSNPIHTYTAAGNYVACFTTTDNQGNVCSQCLDIVIGADSTDLSCITQYNSNPTAEASINWEAQTAPISWAFNFNNGINYAYADCDGDGFIDELDVNVLEQNYGLIHGVVLPDTFIEGLVNIDPILSLGAIIDTLVNPEGMALELPIILGDINNPIADFYGIAFTIEYDPGFIVNDSVSIQFLLNSWINPSNNGLISIQSNDTENGIIEASISRTNHLPINGFGEIGKVSFIIEDNLVGALQQDDNQALDIRIKDVRVVNELLENQAIVSSSHSLFFDNKTATNTPTFSDIVIFPNPVSDQLFIHTRQTNIQTITLHNAAGAQVALPTYTDNHQTTISTKELPSGIYFAKIETNQERIIQKIIIQKN